MPEIPASHRDLLDGQFAILDLAVPYRYLEIRGDAEISPDEDYAFADRSARNTAPTSATMTSRARRASWSPSARSG